MTRKLTYDYVVKAFAEEGYTLLSKNYKNSWTVLDYICPKGHKYSIKWNKWNDGRRCPYCSKNGRVRNVSMEYIREEFKREGYTLLSKKYVDCYTKLNYICPNGHKYSTSWDAWKSKGNRCGICSSNAKLTTEFVREEFMKENYELIGDYVKAHGKLKFRCNNGHLNTTTWASWYEGIRCSICSGKKKHTIEFIKSNFEKYGYTLVTDFYINGKQKLDYICPEGHEHNMCWNNWNNGNRCPTCYVISYFGANNPNWHGGKSLEPYCDAWRDKEYKRYIRNRDGNMCLNPYCYHTDKLLSIHHIDYDKKNCTPKNLITICRSCNSKANKDRDWHKSWYQTIIRNRHSYRH